MTSYYSRPLDVWSFLIYRASIDRRRGTLHTRSSEMVVAASGDDPTAASAPAVSTMDEQVGVMEELDVGNSMLYGWKEVRLDKSTELLGRARS